MDHYHEVLIAYLYKKQQILIQKCYQFIKFVFGVCRSHETADIFFFHLTQHSLLTEMRRHYKAIHLNVTSYLRER